MKNEESLESLYDLKGLQFISKSCLSFTPVPTTLVGIPWSHILWE